ncbi:hypothetical protein TNCV_4395711 [Trichonephila clavipes]|uniref:Uncharacterized protein n=1 Tax=Trichonephila clavipes TaxID=2585209 RepID=A0A8X6W4P0_TRICX|nr:hypothetical protein TNCV_4395711 [Trichonephila clavipes]
MHLNNFSVSNSSSVIPLAWISQSNKVGVLVPLAEQKGPMPFESVKAPCPSVGVVCLLRVGGASSGVHPRPLTDVQNDEIHRQLPSCRLIVRLK